MPVFSLAAPVAAAWIASMSTGPAAGSEVPKGCEVTASFEAPECSAFVQEKLRLKFTSRFTSGSMGADLLQALGQVVLDKATQAGWELLADRLKRVAGCKDDKKADKAVKAVATCKVLDSRIQDLLAQPDRLIHAVLEDWFAQAGAHAPLQLGGEVLLGLSPERLFKAWRVNGGPGLRSALTRELQGALMTAAGRVECEEISSAAGALAQLQSDYPGEHAFVEFGAALRELQGALAGGARDEAAKQAERAASGRLSGQAARLREALDRLEAAALPSREPRLTAEQVKDLDGLARALRDQAAATQASADALARAETPSAGTSPARPTPAPAPGGPAITALKQSADGLVKETDRLVAAVGEARPRRDERAERTIALARRLRAWLEPLLKAVEEHERPSKGGPGAKARSADKVERAARALAVDDARWTHAEIALWAAAQCMARGGETCRFEDVLKACTHLDASLRTEIAGLLDAHAGALLGNAETKGALPRDGVNLVFELLKLDLQGAARLRVEDWQGVVVGLLDNDWTRVTAATIRLVEAVLPTDGERESMRVLLGFLAGVGRYAASYGIEDEKEAAAARRDAISDLVGRMASRRERSSGVVWSIGGSLGLVAGYRGALVDNQLKAITGARDGALASPLHLGLGFALDSYHGKHAHGAHVELTAFDLGQYIAFESSALQVGKPDIKAALAPGLKVGWRFLQRSTPVFLGVYTAIHPFVRSTGGDMTVTVGGMLGIYIPFLDFN